MTPETPPLASRITKVVTVNLVTVHVHPPIPRRNFDWCAYDTDYEPPDRDGIGGGVVGWGATEAAAIADYREIIGEACRFCGRSDYPQSCAYGGCPVGADL